MGKLEDKLYVYGRFLYWYSGQLSQSNLKVDLDVEEYIKMTHCNVSICKFGGIDLPTLHMKFEKVLTDPKIRFVDHVKEKSVWDESSRTTFSLNTLIPLVRSSVDLTGVGCISEILIDWDCGAGDPVPFFVINSF